MATREELRAKAEATRLKNLLAKKASNRPFTKMDESILKKLMARTKAK